MKSEVSTHRRTRTQGQVLAKKKNNGEEAMRALVV